jgi:hypothetical protein
MAEPYLRNRGPRNSNGCADCGAHRDVYAKTKT